MTENIKQIIKRAPKVHNKKEKFSYERQELLKKVNEILNITDTNRQFYGYLVNNDAILGLTEEFKKYFQTSNWPALRKNSIVENKALGMIKSLYKDMGVKFDITSCKFKDKNNVRINTTLYVLE